MSRRSVLLLAATVVLFYFTIILFILKPLHGANSRFAHYSADDRISYRASKLFWCKTLRKHVPPAKHITALASFPGSGNTWLRYLLQQATGIMTGSVYMDYSLRDNGFPAENIANGSVLVVKTHDHGPANLFHSAILLIRNPRDCALADFQRHYKGHIGSVTKSFFFKEGAKWRSYVAELSGSYVRFHEYWLRRFGGARFVLTYDALRADTRAALSAALAFLNHTISQEDMDCVMANKQGIYKRKKKYPDDFDPFTPKMYTTINFADRYVKGLLAEYYRTHNITTVI